jgi:hypothetical protein
VAVTTVRAKTRSPRIGHAANGHADRAVPVLKDAGAKDADSAGPDADPTANGLVRASGKVAATVLGRPNGQAAARVVAGKDVAARDALKAIGHAMANADHRGLACVTAISGNVVKMVARDGHAVRGVKGVKAGTDEVAGMMSVKCDVVHRKDVGPECAGPDDPGCRANEWVALGCKALGCEALADPPWAKCESYVANCGSSVRRLRR